MLLLLFVFYVSLAKRYKPLILLPYPYFTSNSPCFLSFGVSVPSLRSCHSHTYQPCIRFTQAFLRVTPLLQFYSFPILLLCSFYSFASFLMPHTPGSPNLSCVEQSSALRYQKNIPKILDFGKSGLYHDIFICLLHTYLVTTTKSMQNILKAMKRAKIHLPRRPPGKTYASMCFEAKKLLTIYDLHFATVSLRATRQMT